MSDLEFIEQTILADRDDCKTVAKQLQFIWLKDLFYQTGMDLDGCFPDSDDPNDHTIQQKSLLKKTLKDNDIILIDDKDDGIKIYIQEVLIGIWHKPQYILRTDYKQLDRAKRLYVEIIIKYWSVFHNNEIEDVEED